MNTDTYVSPARLAMPVSGRDHCQGSIDAPLTLVEYGDYQCPYCSVAQTTVRALQGQLGDRLCFVFRHFPLAGIHPFAARAAEAAEAAGEQGRFWEMHELLMERQTTLHDATFIRFARALDLDADRLMREVLEGIHRSRVQEDFRMGARSGVNGTPSFFINGVRHDGKPQYEALLEAILKHVPLEGV